jgi:putative NIF3 family GTP cyclohydrolase 1 type 2
VELSLGELIERCRRLLDVKVLPYVGNLSDRVKTVGLLPGSGFIPVFGQRWTALFKAGCNTIISGEISHAAVRFARCAGISLIDPGHNGMIKPGMAHLAYLLRHRLAVHGCDVESYDDTYMIDYYSAWPSNREEGASDPHGGTGVVVPFSR